MWNQVKPLRASRESRAFTGLRLGALAVTPAVVHYMLPRRRRLVWRDGAAAP